LSDELAIVERRKAMRSAPQGLGFYSIAILPTVLSVIAGSADVISFLGLGLFNAHITGNLVILAAHIVARGTADVKLMLSAPIFILVLGLVRLLVAGLQALRVGSLVPLLFLQFLLLAGLFASGRRQRSGWLLIWELRRWPFWSQCSLLSVWTRITNGSKQKAKL